MIAAGVDIGGTFTDLVIQIDGTFRIHKLLSTPDDPSRAVLDGLAAVAPGELAALTRVAHGSTVATNAILERRGARAALMTTRGLRDLLFIGRQNRPDLYALHPTLPPPRIPRAAVYEVPERLDHTGSVLLPLDMAALDAVLDQLEAHQFDAVAVCLLYSYLNPKHEQAVRARIVERGILPPERVILSSDVLPEFREYERTHTTAMEAYIRPIVDRYLTRLERDLPAPLRVMKSDGGVVSAGQARQRAISLALSGPAAGVIGALHIAQHAGYDHIITLDIGGTSTDVALCPGAAVLRSETQIDGAPLRTRTLDIETIGAGGGSLARVDSGGALRVGPESAGAVPGPIVYGLGGEQLTVSDANALLGRLDPDHVLGGTLRLYPERAGAALARLAHELGTAPEDAALGVIEVANANIERAVRRVSVARGHDPREFTLFAFGGAGALHACEVAERLDMRRVLIPRYPGVLCAFGLLAADVRLEYSRALMHTLNSTSAAHLANALRPLLEAAERDLAGENVAPTDRTLAASLDARYVGQAYELNIAYDAHADLAHRFHDAYQRAYGYTLPDRPVEIVNLRLTAVGRAAKPPLTCEAAHANDGAAAVIGRKAVRFRGGVQQTTLYDRERLTPGASISAPAICFQYDSTVLVPPGWSGGVDGCRNLILSRLD